MSSTPTPSGALRHALFPGSFDPFTLGHRDLLKRALRVFDRVTVAVGSHPAKNSLFAVDERLEIIREEIAGQEPATCAAFDGLLVDACCELEARFIVRGVRSSADLEYERPMALTNRAMAPGVETLFLIPSAEVAHISSTLVRQIARMGGDTSTLVAPEVYRRLCERFPRST